MKAMIKNLEVRGYEEKESQKGNKYLIVRAEDTTGKLYEFYEPDYERKEYYKRGQEVNMTIDLTQYKGNWQVNIVDIEHIN